MKILHIFSGGKSDLASKIIEVQSKEHEIETIDLSSKELSYDGIIDKIFSSDRVISW